MAIGRISDIDLRWLYVFIKVVEAGGYSAAQAKLNIGVATISAHMKSLESRLGTQLCRRGRAGFSLTEEGQRIYEEAILLRNAMERFTSISRSLTANLGGKLNIGVEDAITAAGSRLISDAVKRFNQRDNSVQIFMHIEYRQDLEKAVLEGKYDMAIGFFATNYSGIVFTPLYDEEHMLYCGAGHPLFGLEREIRNDDIVDLPISVRGFSTVDDCERLEAYNRRATVLDMEAQLTMLLSGCYLGFLPRNYARPWVESGQLHELNAPEYAYLSPHGVITRQRSSLTRQARLFLADLLRANRCPESPDKIWHQQPASFTNRMGTQQYLEAEQS